MNDQGEYILLVSDQLTPEDESKITGLGIKIIKQSNKSYGGGGSHQCMKNVYTQGDPISVSEWRTFLIKQRAEMSDIQRQETAQIPPDMLFEAVELISRNIAK